MDRTGHCHGSVGIKLKLRGHILCVKKAGRQAGYWEASRTGSNRQGMGGEMTRYEGL